MIDHRNLRDSLVRLHSIGRLIGLHPQIKHAFDNCMICHQNHGRDEEISQCPSSLFVQTYLPKSSFVTVPRLSENDVTTILKAYQQSAGRTHTDHQMAVLAQACRNTSIPLFTKIAFDQVI